MNPGVVVPVLLLVPVALGVGIHYARKRWGGPSRVQAVIAWTAVVVASLAVAIGGIDSALHPSARPLVHRLTSAPVPAGATTFSRTSTDGDVDAGATASVSYGLAGTPAQVCPSVVAGYLRAHYVLRSAITIVAGQRPPVITEGPQFCAGHGPASGAGSDAAGGFDLLVCRTAAGSTTCFEAILRTPTRYDRDLGSGGAGSVLALTSD